MAPQLSRSIDAVKHAAYRAAEPKPHPARPEALPTANVRMAAVILILNAVCVLLELAVERGDDQVPSAFRWPFSAMIDIVLGAALFSKAHSPERYEGARRFVLLRCVLGAIVGAFLALSAKNYIQLVVQWGVVASLVSLLVVRSHARLLRAITGVACVLCLGIEVVGLYILHTGTNPVASASAARSGQYINPTPRRVVGVDAHYEITTEEGWWVYRRDHARQMNPLADQWLNHPATDANLLVIVERLEPSASISVDRVLDGMARNATTVADHFVEVSRGRFPEPGNQRWLEATATLRSPRTPFRYYFSVLVNGPEVIQTTAFLPDSAPVRVREQLRRMMTTMRPTPLGPLAYPADADGNAPLTVVGPGRVVNERFGYHLTLPTSAYQLSDAQVRASNPLICQWIKPSFEGVEVTVIAEEVPAGTAPPMEALVDAVLLSRRVALPNLQVDESAPMQGRSDLHVLRFRTAVEGTEQHGILAILRTERLVVQVTGVCSVSACPAFEAQLREIVTSVAATR